MMVRSTRKISIFVNKDLVDSLIQTHCFNRGEIQNLLSNYCNTAIFELLEQINNKKVDQKN